MTSMMTLLALSTALILHLEMGFPFEGERYLGACLYALLFLLSALRLGTWIAVRGCVEPAAAVMTGCAIQYLLIRVFLRFELAPPALTLLLLIPSLCWRKADVQACVGQLRHLTDAIKHLALFEHLLLALTGGALAFQFFSVLALPIAADALSGHLFAADQLLRAGQATKPYATLLLPLLVLERNGVAINLFGFFLFLVILAGLDALARRQGAGRPARLLIFAAMATSSFFATLTAETSALIFSLAVLIATAVLLAELPETIGKRLHAVRFGLLAGLLFSLASGFEAAAVLLAVFYLSRAGKAGLLSLIAAGAMVLLAWPTGSVMSPTVFSSAGWEEAMTALAPIFIVIPWLGFLSPSSPLTLPTLALLAASLLFGAWPAFAGGLLLLLPAGANFLLRSGGYALRPLLAIALIVSFGATVRRVETSSGILLLQTNAMSYLHYLYSSVKTCGIQTTGDARLPLDARVYSIGEDRLFYLHRAAVDDPAWLTSARHGSERSLAAILRGVGYTHVMYTPPDFRGAGARSPFIDADDERDFVAALRNLPPVITDSRNGLGIYELVVPPGEAP